MLQNLPLPFIKESNAFLFNESNTWMTAMTGKHKVCFEMPGDEG